MKTDSIRIKRITLGGKDYVDIRRCLEGVATKRGLSIPIEKYEEVLKKLREVNGREEWIEL